MQPTSMFVVRNIHSFYKYQRLDERLTLLKTAGLDNCGRQGTSWLFCKSCYSDILSNKVPKFSALNSVNVLMCDLYPDILKDLTLIEECVIARRHPVGCI